MRSEKLDKMTKEVTGGPRLPVRRPWPFPGLSLQGCGRWRPRLPGLLKQNRYPVKKLSKKYLHETNSQ